MSSRKDGLLEFVKFDDFILTLYKLHVKTKKSFTKKKVEHQKLKGVQKI